jgi:acetyl esterase/lipase
MRILIALLLVSAAQDRREKPAPDVKEEKYGTHARNVLDLWKAKSETPTPLVIYIHGGGFRAGSKETLNPQLLKRCLDNGISVASINYRLTDTAPFPAAMHDGARALQHLRHKAKDFNLDPGKVACTGGSAGAGISLWLAFHDDLADAKSDDPVLRQSTRITCAFVNNGQTSYDPRFIKEHIGGRAHEHPALAPFWGLKPDEMETEKADRIFKECSPIRHLTKDDPPVYLSYGGRDLPDEKKPGAGIHHENFGKVLKAEMEKLEIACAVKVGRDQSEQAEMEFVLKHLKPRK